MKLYSDSWCSTFLYKHWVFLICQMLKGRLTVLSWLQTVLSKRYLLKRAESLICMFYAYLQVLHQSPLLHIWRWDGQLSHQRILKWNRKKGKGVLLFSAASLNYKILLNTCKKLQTDRSLDLFTLLAPIQYSFGLLLGPRFVTEWQEVFSCLQEFLKQIFANTLMNFLNM